MSESLVKAIDSNDAKERLCIMVRDDGIFRFFVEFLDFEPGYGEYWSVREFSGLYGSAEEAERDARTLISWLRPTS